ncbi:hypothetical protein EHE19_015490 [Ruminiclostridium herbifermentans]|uniref:Peptidase C39-like domain-containing protein n=1 Tax=Ruminiclostridium herbifermentans TaxID=2488810 RepID=A0A4V6EP94_9FIRM|nr:hypothetical protein [Ruminiclostridium herbifermentans]QNU66269.1 hypothetical protein EHE19_015490 [Ruminiclostridium herbifermentans]
MIFKFLKKPFLTGLLVFSLIVNTCPLSVLAKDNTGHFKARDNVRNLIPDRQIEKIDESELDKLETSVSYGLIESLVTMQGNPDCPWQQQLEDGDFCIKKIVPLYDLDDNLSQTMIIYNDGSMIVDSDSGEVIQYSFGEVDTEYFNENDRCYVDGLSHFSVLGNKVKDGIYKGKDIDKVKNGHNKKQKNRDKKESNRWGTLSDDQKEQIISGFRCGNNEGNPTGDYITDPVTWIKNFEKKQGTTWGDVKYEKGYTKTCPEILQESSDYPHYMDCALISTLEIMGYYWSLTASEKRLAYNSMANSSYYSMDTGVDFDDNDQIFKIAAEVIGKPTQKTSDDPETFFSNMNYSFFENTLKNYGPFYISLYQEPYGSHTVTAKGVIRYSTVNRYNATFNYDFALINDHWSKTSGSTYLSITYGNNTWYATAIKVNY